MYQKTPAEIQSLFNIRADATPEEAMTVARRFKTAVYVPPNPPAYPQVPAGAAGAAAASALPRTEGGAGSTN